MSFELSEYQKQIKEYFIKNPYNNMAIEALAGSGKTSTALMLTNLTKTSDVYVAFNINEKRTRISFEMIRVEFTVFYIDRMHSNDVKILNIDIKENYKE